MGIGKTPQNQLNALPLIDADTASSPGEIQLIGNTMTRYWNATAMGCSSVTAINNPEDSTPPGARTISSGWLDVRGCNNFSLMCKRRALDAAAAADVAIAVIYLQYWYSSVEIPLRDPTKINNTGTVKLGTMQFVAPAAAPPCDAYFVHAFANGVPSAYGMGPLSGPYDMAIGYGVRFWLSWNTTTLLNQLWSLVMWGSSS